MKILGFKSTEVIFDRFAAWWTKYLWREYLHYWEDTPSYRCQAPRDKRSALLITKQPGIDVLFVLRYETCGGWVSTQQRVVSGKWVSTCLPISGHIIYMILSSNTAAPGPVQWLLSPWTLPGTLQFSSTTLALPDLYQSQRSSPTWPC